MFGIKIEICDGKGKGIRLKQVDIFNFQRHEIVPPPLGIVYMSVSSFLCQHFFNLFLKIKM